MNELFYKDDMFIKSNEEEICFYGYKYTMIGNSYLNSHIIQSGTFILTYD